MEQIALITESSATKNELCNQLGALLNDATEVMGYATEEGMVPPITAGLIVFSSQEMYDIGHHLIVSDAPIVIANRTLNLAHLDQLFSIPNGSDVLIVNDTHANAQEIINLLNEVGLDHLNYQPYGNGDILDRSYDYAIAPGEVDLIPASIPNKIDIGARVIDLSTIIEILIRLDLLDSTARFLSARHVETIIRLNRRLHQSSREAMLTNTYLTKVLNHMNDGILVVDHQHRITVFNETCEAIFGIRSATALGKPLAQFIRDPSIYHFLTTETENNELIGKIGENQYILEKLSIDRARLVTIKDTRSSLDLEKKLRHMMMKKGLVAKYHMEDVIGSSALMKQTVETAIKLARTDHNLLIYGESGVGKEIFAQAIHNRSPQANGPFFAINFSALSEELAESELFGYEEGSFTGAKRGGRKGLFEEANGGTIFLDEIGDCSPRIQARLLRVLQEKEIRRIGGSEIIPVHVRVIAATNRNLNQLSREGRFRLDLYHRLKKLYIHIPPLRNHLEDLDALIDHFLRQSGAPNLRFSPQVMTLFRSYFWPGNIRELENLIEYLIVVCDGDDVELHHLPGDDEYHPSDRWEPSLDSMRAPMTAVELPDTAAYCLSEIDRLILQVIAQASLRDVGIGREAVRQALIRQVPTLSDHRIRLRVKHLADHGLIIIGPGRAGMRLSEKGRSLCHPAGRNATFDR